MDYINTNIITKSLKSLLTSSNRKISPAVPSTEFNMSDKHIHTSEKITTTSEKITHAPPRPPHQQKIAMLSASVSVETRSTEEQSKVPNHRPQKPTYTHSHHHHHHLFNDRRSALQNSDERLSARQLRRMKRRLFLEAVNSTNQSIHKISPRNSIRISKRSTGRE